MNKTICYPLILFSIFFTLIHASEQEICLFSSHDPSTKIVRLQVFSERCSGSTYVHLFSKKNLINANDKPFSLQDFIFGHRHWPADYKVPFFEWNGPREFYTFEGSDDTIFLILFRNPYDWIRSIRQNPHGASNELWNQNLSNFIRIPWSLNYEHPVCKRQREINPYVDMNYDTKGPFENVMKLRSAKIRMMLDLTKVVKNYYVVQYEKIMENPLMFLNEIASKFDLNVAEHVDFITTYKGLNKHHYIPSSPTESYIFPIPSIPMKCFFQT